MNLVRATIWAMVAVVSSMSVAITSEAQSFSVGDEAFGDNLIALKTQLSRGGQRQLADVGDRYRIVFVPGILGSKLTAAGGAVVWGEGEPIADRLVYDAHLKVTATMLWHYDFLGISLKDVYGQFGSQLARITDRCIVYYFPYDWRSDLGESATKFDEYLLNEGHVNGVENPFAGKKLILVAHSMGGLVVKEWLKEYYDKRMARHQVFESVDTVMFLGTPHAGSATLFWSLAYGYIDIGDSSIAGRVTKALFNKEDMFLAVHSFPGIFQLIPPYDRDHAFLKGCSTPRCGSAGVSPINQLNIAHWCGYGFAGRLLAGKSCAAAKLDERLSGRYNRLVANLARAEKVVSDLYTYKIPKEIQARYYYGEQYRTIGDVVGVEQDRCGGQQSDSVCSRVVEDLGGTKYWKFSWDASAFSGDGRVTASSARHGDPTYPQLGARLFPEHDLLFQDPAFQKDLVFAVYGRGGASRELGEIIIGDDAIERVARQTDFLFPLNGNVLDSGEVRIQGDMTSAMEFNSSVGKIRDRVAGGGEGAEDWDYVAGVNAARRGDANAAGVYFTMEFAKSKRTLSSSSLEANWLGYYWLGTGDCRNAQTAFRAAGLGAADRATTAYALKGRGRALECLGMKGDAKAAYEAAAVVEAGGAAASEPHSEE